MSFFRMFFKYAIPLSVAFWLLLVLAFINITRADTLVILPESTSTTVLLTDPITKEITGTTVVETNMDIYRSIVLTLKTPDNNPNVLDRTKAPIYIKDKTRYHVFNFHDGQLSPVDMKQLSAEAKVIVVNNSQLWLEQNGFKPEQVKQ